MAPIIILGASLAGLPLAHHLLNILPNEKIILVNPSTHFYFNIASPRALLGPSALGKNAAHLHVPIAQNFTKYPESRFEFVQGKAIDVLPGENLVVIKKFTDDTAEFGGEDIRLNYGHLVIATGANAIDGGVFKQTTVGTYKDLRSKLESLTARIEDAKTIVLSGAGATGVETAGEIASRYPGKKVILVSSDSRVLQMVREDLGAKAWQLLQKLGVEVRLNAKVVKESKAESGTEVVLETGESILADVYIPTHGLVPNTGFLHKEWLNEKGWVVTDEYMRVAKMENVWAVGDVTPALKKCQTIDEQLFPLAKNMKATIEGKGIEAFIKCQHGDLILAVTVGPKFGMGVGIWGGWWIWGWVVWWFKGRDFMISKAVNIVAGKNTILGNKV
ncbi:hypothetical protein RUND412_010796 [Rhizina undulata]